MYKSVMIVVICHQIYIRLTNHVALPKYQHDRLFRIKRLK